VADRLVAPGGGAPVLAQHAHVRRAAEVAGQHVGARQEDDALGAGDADEAQPLLLDTGEAGGGYGGGCGRVWRRGPGWDSGRIEGRFEQAWLSRRFRLWCDGEALT
jgi:hypothetical protein